MVNYSDDDDGYDGDGGDVSDDDDDLFSSRAPGLRIAALRESRALDFCDQSSNQGRQWGP